VIAALVNADPHKRTLLPSFDKARDDRNPPSDWTVFEGRADIVLFEGWCVGAVPQESDALSAPVNDLEATEDRDATWRRYVNDRLAGEYTALFRMLDRLVMLRVPDMASVYRFRGLQESKLAATPGAGPQHFAMDGDALRRFIMHYERLTLWMLTEMPGRADVTLALDSHQQIHHLQLLH
jgi:D-glycerate 3-kinase